MRPLTGHRRGKAYLAGTQKVVASERFWTAARLCTGPSLGSTRVCDYQTNTSALTTQNGIARTAAPQIGHC